MPRYRAEPAGNVRIEPLDGLTLIYHRRSGATHLVAEPMPQILVALADGPASPQEVVARLADVFELGDNAPVVIAARLAELADLGLVHRSDDSA